MKMTMLLQLQYRNYIILIYGYRLLVVIVKTNYLNKPLIFDKDGSNVGVLVWENKDTEHGALI